MTTFINKVISLNSKKTSMRLTGFEWRILDSICRAEKIKRKTLLELIEQNRDQKTGLTPAVRLFSLMYIYTFGNRLSTANDIYKVLRCLKK
ncbi:MAG: ribbon-helix-helix domain-containing protein [Alphaproteobacteria bacterium]